MKTKWRMLLSTLLASLLLITTLPALADVYDALGVQQQETNANEPLPAEQAFHLTYTIRKHAIELHWRIAPHYYLYKTRFHLTLQHNRAANLGQVIFPTAQVIDDPYFGQVGIYKNQLTLNVPIYGKVTPKLTLQVRWQGCSGKVCYPQQTQTIALFGTALQNSKPAVITGMAASTHSLHHWLSDHHYGMALLILFDLGLLLSFTPCVLPMIPILSAIVVGQKDRSLWQALALAISYVLGMAITYTIIGMAIGSIGASFQSALQTPWVLSVFALIFVLLALSMFDLYQLKLPNRWQNAVHQWQQHQTGGKVIGVFIIGALSSLILSPCTSAPLIGVLGYIAQTGNWAFGGLALFVMAIGMGVPLLIISIGANQWLPKTGTWMIQIKYFFGLLLLLVALYLLQRVLPGPLVLFIGGTILIVYGFFLGRKLTTDSAWEIVRKAISWVIVLYGIALMAGGLMGNRSFIQPLALKKGHTPIAKSPFIRVDTLTGIQQQLAIAAKNQQPVLLDFYANWCIECHKLASETLNNPKVLTALKRYRLVQVDVTRSNKYTKQIVRHYHILGLPTLLLFNAQGHIDQRLVGYLTAPALLKAIQ